MTAGAAQPTPCVYASIDFDPDPYNVSAYDGITFRARTGGGPATQPVFVEILTRETQPSTAGGTATSQAVDLYNNRGFFANVASSTFQLATARVIGVTYMPPRTYGLTVGYQL